mgnify:CR=1 FL=1|jgi:hypothetical protein
MNYKIFIITLALGYIGTMTVGNLLNIPDAGSILSIAFIGSCIIKKLDKKGDGS